jgi:3-hydroxybenzoate 6-monooxygenase
LLRGTHVTVVAKAPVLVAGGGIGGLAAALALARQGFPVKVLEQAPEMGEIGAGIQLGPNAFAAFDALGVGERARARAVYTERMVLMDAVDESEVASVPVGEAFRTRFRNPYAVIHRADVHKSLLEGVEATERIEFRTSTRIERVEQTSKGVVAIDAAGGSHEGCALIGCDGVKSVVRQQYIGDPVRVSGHVVYRAVVEAQDFPADLRWNAPAVWCGPNCHLVHYPLRGGEQYNVVVTFHSNKQETWSVTEGSSAEVLSYFGGISARPRQLLHLPKSWKRWATADREPVERWTYDRVTLLGDAAHPMLQYLAQGACMALEDAVTLGEALRVHAPDLTRAFERYQRSRVTRTARVVLSAREMGRIYHAKGVERLVRNDLWKGRPAERFYDALEWLYGWRVENCLAA